MKKSAKKDVKFLYESAVGKKTFDTVLENMNYSYEEVVEPQLEGWDEKESMLLGKNEDAVSSTTKSQVYDPRLSTIVFERCARVMAQNPSGKATAMSKDDKGKNLFMNLILDKWILPNANSQYDSLIKNRLWDMYSNVYGVFFKLIDRVNTENYQGPDSYLLPIRSVRPQPNRFSLGDSDWIGVETFVTREWLKDRDKDTWKNIDTVLRFMKEGKVTDRGVKDAQERSYIEQERQPNVRNDPNSGKVRLYTEYRRDRWVTIFPDFDERLIGRDIENPHGDEKLPVVAKYSFPLIDSIYGLGEFERGKSLQFAINSLINLYLDGVAMSIFPPLIINPDSVVPSTIIDEPAARWLLSKSDPNAISQPPRNPGGIQTFQSTYNFMTAALMNLAGTTDTSTSSSTDPTQGKTPQALKMIASRENSRDAWDRFMMEKALEEEMTKYVNLTANGTDKPIELTLFKAELDEIQKSYPDVVEMYSSGERGNVTIDPKEFQNVKYNYTITSGSTYKADQDKELQNIQELLNFTLQNYQVLQPAFQQKGKSNDITELYTRTLITSGTQDWDKIVVDMPQQGAQQGMEQGMGQGMQPQMNGQMPQGMQQGAPQGNVDVYNQPVSPQLENPQTPEFVDPDIQQLAQKMFTGKL